MFLAQDAAVLIQVNNFILQANDQWVIGHGICFFDETECKGYHSVLRGENARPTFLAKLSALGWVQGRW